MTMSKLDSELKSYIERPNGFMFRFKKIDNNFIHTYCEGRLLGTLGLTPSMIVNKTLYEFLPFEIAQRKEQFYEQAWSGEYTNYEGFLNGIYYIAVLMPILEDGKVIEVMATTFDITKEKQNEEKMKKAEKFAVVGQLAAGIAHEIRNPLTSLKGFTQILQEKVIDKDQKDYIEIMVGELNRIQRIVNEFMMLSNPNETFTMTKANINTLIMNVIKFLRPEAYLNNIEITTDFKAEISAECDVNQIKQVLFNLLQNAIEASSTKKSKIIITLLDLDTNHYEIMIKDFGKGIPLVRQKHLFEPFYTTKEKGTGLGLMVCKQIVNFHNGEIIIESQENVGTVVRIHLPKRQKSSSY